MKSSSRLIMLLLCLLALTANAQIYKWVDANGKTHFSDHPPASKKHNQPVRLPSLNGMKAVDASTMPPNKRVIMYSTNWCGYCKRARAYFKRHKIPFTEKDIEKSARANKEYKRLKGNGVPLILVGTTKIQGFNQPKFEAAYY